MNRIAIIRCASRRLATAAPQTSTGIEHADAMAKAGGQKPDWKLYKVQDYLKMIHYSFYEAEVNLEKHRLQQPSNKKPDIMPKTKAQ